MAESVQGTFTPFDKDADAKAFQKIRQLNGIKGHEIVGDKYIALLNDGRRVAISLSVTLHDLNALGKSGKAQGMDDIDVLRRLSERAHSKVRLDDLTMQQLNAVAKDYSDVLTRSFDTSLGK